MKTIVYIIIVFITILTVIGLINFFYPKNCSDFYGSHNIAQKKYENNKNKYYHLDGDDDGTACESLLTRK